MISGPSYRISAGPIRWGLPELLSCVRGVVQGYVGPSENLP